MALTRNASLNLRRTYEQHDNYINGYGLLQPI